MSDFTLCLSWGVAISTIIVTRNHDDVHENGDHVMTRASRIVPLLKPHGVFLASRRPVKFFAHGTFAMEQSLGCYTDNTNKKRILSHMSKQCGVGERAMSPSICASYCATIPGMTLFGLENSYQCFCGTSGENYGSQGNKKANDCKFLCTAFPDFFCGGSNAMEVFSIGKPGPTPAPVGIEPSLPGPVIIGTAEPTPAVAVTPAPTEAVTPAPTEAVVVTTPPKTDTSPDNYGYLGCFADDRYDRVLTGPSLKRDPYMSTSVSTGSTKYCVDAPFTGSMCALARYTTLIRPKEVQHKIRSYVLPVPSFLLSPRYFPGMTTGLRECVRWIQVFRHAVFLRGEKH